MPNENNLLPEHAQLAAVLDNPDAIQRIKEPTEKVQIAAVQKRRCVKMRTFFFYAQSPDFHKQGLCYYLKILYL